MPYRRSKCWGFTKPPCGTPINFGHPLAIGLSGFWLLNEGAGNFMNDSVGNLNYGTNTSVPWCNALFGAGLSFQGVSHNWVQTKITLTGAPGFTIGCWCMVSASTGGFTYILGDNNFSGFRFPSGTTVSLCDSAQDISSGIAIGGKWTQVVGSLDGTNGIIYINGKKAGSAASTVTTWNSVEMGACGNGANNGIGLMDHCFLYKRPLSPTEVMALYQQPFAMFSSPRRRIISGSAVAGAAEGNYAYNFAGVCAVRH